jgi:hypothetical protein
MGVAGAQCDEQAKQRNWTWQQASAEERTAAIPVNQMLASNRARNPRLIIARTELSNLARLRLPPSTMLSKLISVLPMCSLFVLLETEPGAPSPLLYPFIPSLWLSAKLPCALDPRLLKPDRDRLFFIGGGFVLADALRRPRP